MTAHGLSNVLGLPMHRVPRGADDHDEGDRGPAPAEAQPSRHTGGLLWATGKASAPQARGRSCGAV